MPERRPVGLVQPPLGPPLPAAVWSIAGVVALVLLALAPRYGWHRDELYFLEAGRNLAWGYVDQPPFTPLVARIADEAAAGNLVALRLLPALATAATIVLGALSVRELGGGRWAQVMAALSLALGGYVLGAGHVLATATFDLTAWMALLWIAARLLRTGDVRWWGVFGVVAGVALLNKHLVVILAVTLLVAIAAERRWELLVTPWLVLGGLVAVAIAAPNLAWQAANGWPQVEMAAALSERLAGENRVTLLPLQWLFLGPLLVPLLWWGAGWLGRAPEARAFRALLWAWPIGLALTFVTAGRPYYVVPLTLVVALAGVVTCEHRRGRHVALPWLVAANALVTIPLALPVLPVSLAGVSATVNQTVAETIGWPEMVGQVATVIDQLPADERDGVVLLTASYGEAGAIDRYGPDLGLPPAYSAHNSYADFRRPTDDDATVVAVRYSPGSLSRWFDECEQVATVENEHDIANEVAGTPIVVCRGLRGSWEAVWPQLRHLD